MNTYWVSWWSGNYIEEGCTRSPFKYWCSGFKERNNSSKTDLSLCAVIKGKNETEIKDIIYEFFPDYELRFCIEKEDGYEPNKDRFQN